MKSRVYAVMLTVVFVLLPLLFLSSCVVHEGGGAGAPPPPGRLMAEGRPAFAAREAASYWIWHDRDGWHLRVTTAGARRQFRGTIESSGGAISNFHPTRLEWRDRVAVEGGRVIRFDLMAHGGIDGFDWRTTSGCNFFDLYIDGSPQPTRVFVGAFAANPPFGPFEACP